jgi:(p)ppGpp synthase/HD superfamily hydrolase
MTEKTFKKGEMLGEMIHLAVNFHKGQYDRGGNAYFLHVLAVMQLLETTDEELQCIAVGHDLWEDTSCTQKDLENVVTKRVIDGIRCLTKQNGEDYEEYKQKVFSNRDAMIVKMADIRHNTDFRRLKGISEKDTVRMGKYMLFYAELQQRIKNV